jgi:hypothetical protein
MLRENIYSFFKENLKKKIQERKKIEFQANRACNLKVSDLTEFMTRVIVLIVFYDFQFIWLAINLRVKEGFPMKRQN